MLRVYTSGHLSKERATNVISTRCYRRSIEIGLKPALYVKDSDSDASKPAVSSNTLAKITKCKEALDFTTLRTDGLAEWGAVDATDSGGLAKSRRTRKPDESSRQACGQDGRSVHRRESDPVADGEHGIVVVSVIVQTGGSRSDREDWRGQVGPV